MCRVFTGNMKYSFNFDPSSNDYYCPTSFIRYALDGRCFFFSHSSLTLLEMTHNEKKANGVKKASTKICMKIASRSCRKYSPCSLAGISLL